MTTVSQFPYLDVTCVEWSGMLIAQSQRHFHRIRRYSPFLIALMDQPFTIGCGHQSTASTSKRPLLR